MKSGVPQWLGLMKTVTLYVGDECLFVNASVARSLGHQDGDRLSLTQAKVVVFEQSCYTLSVIHRMELAETLMEIEKQ